MGLTDADPAGTSDVAWVKDAGTSSDGAVVASGGAKSKDEKASVPGAVCPKLTVESRPNNRERKIKTGT